MQELNLYLGHVHSAAVVVLFHRQQHTALVDAIYRIVAIPYHCIPHQNFNRRIDFRKTADETRWLPAM